MLLPTVHKHSRPFAGINAGLFLDLKQFDFEIPRGDRRGGKRGRAETDYDGTVTGWHVAAA